MSVFTSDLSQGTHISLGIERHSPFLSYHSLNTEEQFSVTCHNCPARKRFGRCPFLIFDNVNVAKFLCPAYLGGFDG